MGNNIFFNHEKVKIINDDVLLTEEIPNESVDLIVTSPPYNVGIKYNSYDDKITYKKYLEFSHKWLSRCFKWLKNDGRLCLNVLLNKNKENRQSMGADFTTIAKKIGYKYHSTIIWNKRNVSQNTAWGSWLSASAPYIISPVELILVLYKNNWKKNSGSRKNDITKQEFINWTYGVWSFNGQSKRGAWNHPAPFPVELPKRCIKLFSFVGDVVLDPFMGSGTTMIASILHNRKGIGIEIDSKYCEIAKKRILKETKL